jgi:hypothetical protein
MKVNKETKVKYSLNEKELGKIVLKSLGLREELLGNIVFIVDTTGGVCTEEKSLAMEITMLYTDDVSGLEV